ncbi:hypothetical protein LEN26_012825, partial [Aphanomyces euteiches]
MVLACAKCITCMGLYKGRGHDKSLLQCAQVMLCPTKPDGTGADCTKGPHYKDAAAAWGAAGILPVFANGNKGHACGAFGSYISVICVGAIGSYDSEANLLAYLSPKGAQAANVPAYIKPDVSAPGLWACSVAITI